MCIHIHNTYISYTYVSLPNGNICRCLLYKKIRFTIIFHLLKKTKKRLFYIMYFHHIKNKFKKSLMYCDF